MAPTFCRAYRRPPCPCANHSVADTASAANFKSVFVAHVELDLTCSFSERRLCGSATLSLRLREGVARAAGAQAVVLDVHESMEVRSVSVLHGADCVSKPFEVCAFTAFGQALHVTVPREAFLEAEGYAEARVLIKYATTPQTPATTWMEPVQTHGKELPFLFTQGQPCLNRSLFPCMDTPAVRFTFNATLRVPKGFTAVMSAELVGKEEQAEGSSVYKFTMPQPISAYLVAIAVGDLCAKDIGPRSKVWAERSLLDAAAWEFDGMPEKYIKAAEELYGPYRWETYDICVMPPSFPFGGMENPRMAFVTPCLLTGDRSLGDVIAHEIAHCWFGNLVTNANWSEFWLNEGFTMFAQRRITDRVHGKAFTALEAATGRKILMDDIAEFGPQSDLTKLRCPVGEGVNPEDTYNETPYEKGYAMVAFMQSLVGEAAFDTWLGMYAEKFAFTSIVAEDMYEFFFAEFPRQRHKLDMEKCLNSPGLPEWLPDLSAGDVLLKPVDRLLDDLEQASKDVGPLLAARAPEFEAWVTYQKFYFLDLLVGLVPSLPAGAVGRLGEAFRLLSSKNAEIRLRYGLCIAEAGEEQHYDYLRAFLESQGKQKYTLPLYRALLRRGGAARDVATSTYRATKASLHPNVQHAVDKLLTEVGAEVK